MKINYRIVILTALIFTVILFFSVFYTAKRFNEWRIYNLEELVSTPLELPPATMKDAAHAAYSLPEVKAAMAEPHKRLLDQVSSLNKKATPVYWIVNGSEKHPPEVSEHSWFITFRTNYRPAYICTISFTDTEIVKGFGHVDCGYEKK
jgi:hypothetical protein